MRQLAQSHTREVIGDRHEISHVLSPALYGTPVTVTSIRELPDDRVAVCVAINTSSSRPQWTWGHIGQLALAITAVASLAIFVWALMTITTIAITWVAANTAAIATAVVLVVLTAIFLVSRLGSSGGAS